jgi:hypothetical protein
LLVLHERSRQDGRGGRVDVVTMLGGLPDLRRPVLVAAFEGWNDAGECASRAIDTIGRGLDVTPFAEIEPEEFFDFQHVRPHVRTAGDGTRVIEWPANVFSFADVESSSSDLVLLDGTEPNLRWKTFTTGIVELALELGVGMVVSVGALQVDVPHTRPVPLTITTPDARLAEELAGVSKSSYEGPTGLTGVLHAAASAAGLPAVSMWAGVPHYLSGTPYLPGALALAERIAAILEVDLPLGRLARDAAAQTDEIAELLAADDELADYVAELEARTGIDIELPGQVPDDEVTGDELAAEFERYLRGDR